MVISASWLSRTGEVDTKYNLRGVSTVLALANLLTRPPYFLKAGCRLIGTSTGHSHWAKDLIFVISDGHLEGMHAFLSTYHGESQPSTCMLVRTLGFADSTRDLQVEPLTLSSGVIWTALNIDYPGHSFSHLGVFFGLSLTNLSGMQNMSFIDHRGPKWASSESRSS
jgi:glycosylphosphatidylinositol transamidase